MRAISARMFVERAGQPCLLGENITLDKWQRGEFVLTGHLPRDLGLASPQTLYMVFQESDNPRTFFDNHQPGKLIVFDRFRVVEGTPLALLRNQATGEVTLATPEFKCTYDAVSEEGECL